MILTLGDPIPPNLIKMIQGQDYHKLGLLTSDIKLISDKWDEQQWFDIKIVLSYKDCLKIRIFIVVTFMLPYQR